MSGAAFRIVDSRGGSHTIRPGRPARIGRSSSRALSRVLSARIGEPSIMAACRVSIQAPLFSAAMPILTPDRGVTPASDSCDATTWQRCSSSA